ncbi:MAG: glycosyltransferase family 4 protein [Candidatus Omnitrophica bacterium]|nr:glycosyltransferase family 4 protein [Candidatus Omnitrophota bacterium]
MKPSTLPDASIGVSRKGFIPFPAPTPQQACGVSKRIKKHIELNPLRIALLSWESLHSISVGGIGAHVTQLAAALERKGHEVHVFTRIGWDGHAQHECIHGVHYHRIPYTHHSNFIEDVNNMCRSFVTSVFHHEDYMGAHFDIVHAHDWLTSNAMVWIKEGRGRKTVLTIHSTEYGRCGNNFWGGPSAHIRDHERHGTFCADKIIAVSNTLKNEVTWMYNLPDWKVKSIYNGVSCHDFDGCLDAGDVKKRYGIGPFEPMVLFAGRMTVQKGPDILVEAIPFILHHHYNAKFVFAGDGHLRGAVEDRARQLGVNHATRFIGHQDAWNLSELYKACDCVCVPSRNEPFGIVILEAWSAGKPVVASKNGGPSELIWHDVTGLKISPTPDSVAWGIGTLFGNFEHARWMGSKGREAVEKCFSWDHIAEQTLDFYKQ